MKSKRPWKKYAWILRFETNGGDVKFRTSTMTKLINTSPIIYGFEDGPAGGPTTFESLTEAEQTLDAWWADWWPKQTKSVRRA